VLTLVFGAAATTGQQTTAGATALDRLKAGNARYVRNAATPLAMTADVRQAKAKGQEPFAMVLSCADSRVPPEVIFNAGLGDLFVVRTAGQVTDKAVLASLEYGAEHLHVPLMVVMGHESCGAVKVAIEAKPGAPSMGPNLDALVAAIKPAFERMSSPADLEHLRDAILANVEQVVNDTLRKSAVVKHLVDTGALAVVGAHYEFATGLVRFSQPVAAGAAHKPANESR
jgi:carbonic anhydrase